MILFCALVPFLESESKHPIATWIARPERVVLYSVPMSAARVHSDVGANYANDR